MTVHRLLVSVLALCSTLAACEGSNPLDVSDSESLTVRHAKSASTFAAPSNATAAATGTDRIAVAWQDNATTESGLEIHRSISGGAYSLLTSKTADSQAHTDSPLNPSTNYCYRIRALRLSGNRTTYSAFSNTACATTPAPPPPAPPAVTDVVAVASATVVGVSWKAEGTNASGFRVERSTGSGGWAEVGNATNGSWQLNDYASVAEQAMCYRVFAFNTAGNSPASSTACVTPLAAPTSFSAVRISGGVELTWIDNSAFENGYTLAMESMSCCSGACEAYDPNYVYEVIAQLPANTTRFVYETEVEGSSCTFLHLIARGTNAESSAPPVTIP